MIQKYLFIYFLACALLFIILLVNIDDRKPASWCSSTDVNYTICRLSEQISADSHEDLLYADVIGSRRLYVSELVVFSEFLGFFLRHDAICGHVAFVSNEDNAAVRVGLHSRVPVPPRKLVERLAVGDIEHQNDAKCASKVGFGDCIEPFLAGGVPNHHLDGPSLDRRDIREIFDSDGALRAFHELVVNKATNYRRLPRPRAPNHDEFELKRLIAHE